MFELSTEEFSRFAQEITLKIVQNYSFYQYDGRRYGLEHSIINNMKNFSEKIQTTPKKDLIEILISFTMKLIVDDRDLSCRNNYEISCAGLYGLHFNISGIVKKYFEKYT